MPSRGRGEHLRGAFEGEGRYQRDAFVGVYHLPGAGKMIRVLKGGYETRLLQTDDASDEGDGVEV